MSFSVGPNSVYTFSGNSDPTASVASGAYVPVPNSFYYNTTAKTNFYCVDATMGAQIWAPVASPIVSFSPLIQGSTSAGTATYTVQSGFYILTGFQVVLSATCTWTGHTGTGNMELTGFPTPIRNLTRYKPIGCVEMDNIALTAGIAGVVAAGIANTTTIRFSQIISSTAHTTVPMSSSGTVHVTLGYIQ